MAKEKNEQLNIDQRRPNCKMAKKQNGKRKK
jgi:hypothetical protein